MPEGPEVRTIVKELNEKVKEKKIIKLEFSETASKLSYTTNIELEEKIINKKIKETHRIGKYIDIEFDESTHLITHLLITGRLSYYDNKDRSIPKYFKIALHFEDGSRLCLGDKRGWTKFRIMTSEEIKSHKNFNDLGIDIFSEEFNLENFTKIINAKKPIYLILMDQKKISGLGNIYVNEVLFQTNINPQKKGDSLTNKQVNSLFIKAKEIMELAYSEKGTTIKSFVERTPSSVGWHTLDGSEGGYYKYLKVFDKTGQKCPICTTPIEKIKLGGRNAFYCPICQPLSNQQELCF